MPSSARCAAWLCEQQFVHDTQFDRGVTMRTLGLRERIRRGSEDVRCGTEDVRCGTEGVRCGTEGTGMRESAARSVNPSTRPAQPDGAGGAATSVEESTAKSGTLAAIPRIFVRR